MEEWITVSAPLIGIAGLWWELTTSMVTKAELNAMKNDLRDEIGEMKSDIVAIRSELKADMADLKVDLKAENAELRADIREIRQLLNKNIIETGIEGKNSEKTWAEIEVQSIQHHVTTRDVVIRCYSMGDSRGT